MLTPHTRPVAAARLGGYVGEVGGKKHIFELPHEILITLRKNTQGEPNPFNPTHILKRLFLAPLAPSWGTCALELLSILATPRAVGWGEGKGQGLVSGSPSRYRHNRRTSEGGKKKMGGLLHTGSVTKCTMGEEHAKQSQ